jgi:serine/threonine protein kinase
MWKPLRGMPMRARDYQPGEHVPGTVYMVVRLIGAGGMGTVYDVEDTSIGKRYVLKTLHPKLGAREDLARRIQHEARTLARLNHPNIVEVITAGVTADDLRLPYYLMERLSGQSLRVILEKKGQLELSHAYHIGIDLLDALDHAHDKGVIHRDVKPDNIFLHRTVAGVTVTKLLDFGIVSMLDGDNGETAGRFLGTLRYASPEQLRGDKPSPKIDVYAAALVLYEIVAGRGPFDDLADGRRIAAAHMAKIPPPLSRFAPDVPKELDLLVAAALAKSPATRPRDAFSFAASLRNLKRKLEGTRPRETTDSRVTAAALAPDSASALHGGAPEPDASPPPASPSGSPVDTRGALDPAPTTLPRTTLLGMPLSSLGPLAGPAPFTGTTAPDLDLDRVCATNTLHPGPPDALRVSPYGTEATGPLHADPAPPSAEAQAPPLVWPPERSAARSLEPQIRSLRVPSSVRSGRGLAGFGARFGVGAAVVGLVAASAVSIARRAKPADMAWGEGPAASAAASLVPGPTGVELVLPAPTLAPPALDVPVGATTTPSNAPPPSARPPVRTVPPPSRAAPTAPIASTPPSAPARPGPGF